MNGYLLSIFFLFALVLIIVLILMLQDNRSFRSTPCASGECAVNLFNGEKRCGADIAADPRFEFCSAANACTAVALPYALLSTGATQIRNCTPGVACRCATTHKCAEYIQSVFTAQNGNPLIGFTPTSTATFVQTEYQRAFEVNPNSLNPELEEISPLTFCSVPLNWLARSSPGCAAGNSDCFSSEINPCLKGRLAVVPDPGGAIDLDNVVVGCVLSKSDPVCAVGTVPAFNEELGDVFCRELSL